MTDKKRRQFVTFMGAGTVAIPVTALVGSRLTHADDLPMVDEASDAAKNWEYVAASATDGQTCAGCALYQGNADGESGKQKRLVFITSLFIAHVRRPYSDCFSPPDSIAGTGVYLITGFSAFIQSFIPLMWL